MFRTSILASLIFGLTGIAVFAEDARQLTCSGTMIEPSVMSCQRRSKNASARRNKNTSMMVARRPRTGGFFVSHQVWVG
jgi:hypothetical protein